MKKGLAILLAVLLIAAVCLPLRQSQSAPAQGGRGFSIVTLQPELEQAMRAKGEKLQYPFPNSLNHGRKFNPGGELLQPVVTDPTQKVLVLFIEFQDAPPGGPVARLDLATYFDAMLFGTVYNPPDYAGIPGMPKDRTLLNYYKEVSYGQVTVVTLNLPSDLGWLTSAHDYAYYCRPDGLHDYGFGYYPENAQGLVEEAIHLADPVVDFSVYAKNGEVPNLFVVHAGTGAEWNVDPAVIWSHSWSLDSGTGLDGVWADNVKLNNYAMMPEIGGDTTGYYSGVIEPAFPPTVGVYAHEYGHVLGLPDQYDYGYESEGTGPYSLMASGSWNRYPNVYMLSGNSPSHIDAWSKWYLGFVTPVEITSLTNVTLPPVELYPDVYKMVVPNSGGKEYFLFENRQQIGFDKSFARWGPHVHGLAIYHVDDTVFTRNFWRPNEAENWKEIRSTGWRKAWNGESHYGISIIQADDRWHMEKAQWTGFDSDLYPGKMGVTTFGNYTFPNSTTYYYWPGNGPKYGYSGITAGNITETAGVIHASLDIVPWGKNGK
jgi:M6 family metalloprotease-like protein